jgi:hypothetical protein
MKTMSKLSGQTLRLYEQGELDHPLETWQTEHRRMLRLDSLGFGGDGDVVALGLDEMEDEITLDEARRRLKYGIRDERHRYRGIPMSMCSPAEARQAREADIDSDMTRKEWDDGE